MTNDPDLVLQSHGSVARDPTRWLRVGLGCREQRDWAGAGQSATLHRAAVTGHTVTHTTLTSKLHLTSSPTLPPQPPPLPSA